MIVIGIALVLIVILRLLNNPWNRANSLQHWRYGFDRKVTDKRLWKGPNKTDCSGFVTYVLGLPRKVGSWEIVKRVNAKKMFMLNEADMQNGTIIAYDSGPLGFDEDRDNGVDHIGVVLKGWDGNLYLCDCKQKHGVRIRPLRVGIVDWNLYALEKGFGTEYMSKFGLLTKAFYVG